MKLNTVEVEGKVYALVQDGKPLYTAEDGKEIAHDAAYTISTITRLNREAQQHRERAEAAEGKLKPFEGIEDPVAALKAIETMANIDQSKLLQADKVDELKRGVTEALESRYNGEIKSLKDALTEATSERDGLKVSLDREVIGGKFSNSKFIQEKMLLPADIAQDSFARHFKLEDGKAIPYDSAGNKIYSRARVGEVADFDEAMEIIVDAHPRKGDLLKGTGNSGSGAREGEGISRDGKSILRSEFTKLAPDVQMAKIRDGIKVVE